MEPSWSLHLLSEILAAFSPDDPENLRTVLNRVAESVEAEVAMILSGQEISCSIGLPLEDRAELLDQVASRPTKLSIKAGELFSCWAPIGTDELLLVGRLSEPFDLEERSLLRAMARSIELSLRMLEAISAERQARLDASYQARHDPLTDLPNRLLVLERLNALLENAAEGKTTRSAVLFIDIDRFKWLNDAHGHAAGDELLMHVGRTLQRSVRQGDLVGRFSGDEFIVITAESSQDGACELARRIITAIRQPIQVAGTELSHSASVGISFTEPGQTASTVIENADMAMYRAKAMGRGQFALFDPSLREEARDRLALEESLRMAVNDRQIQAFLQPIVRLADGELLGFEALARWQHPQLGLLAPATFISAAEENGLIEEIDLGVLEQACQAMAQWQHHTGRKGLRLSVNVSARTLGASDLIDRLQPLLLRTQIQPGTLLLEITETALVQDIPSITSTIADLQQLGLKLAIDDFGTGYSSLLYLKRFPVGVLKIDRSFVADLGRDPEDEAIAQAIISLGHSLNVEVVAEGVETEEQERILLELGCSLGQGYRYGQPEPISSLAQDYALTP
ncbi:MAG: putative bifunctional diguanylate cyclase/phosphodiesterase [Vulcanococcus sp.]